MSEATFSRLHGLIIGIDKYLDPKSEPSLGCVNDATSMLEYFTKGLGICSSHFRCLFNEEATETNIINAFISHLTNNPDIQPFDPIVVYYAGLGGAMPDPEFQPSYVEDGVLKTYDAGTNDANGEYIFGIQHKVLRVLLYRLSLAKGNNITVILDADQSGSHIQGAGIVADPGAYENLDARLMSANLDGPKIRELSPNNRGVSERLQGSSRETHVLLAACRNDEQAQEVEGRGLFTYALLRAFEEYGPLMMSYSTLLRSVLDFVSRAKIPGAQGRGARYMYRRQTPQCEGRNQHRLLFSTRPSVSKGKIALMRSTRPGIFRIRAGSAAGIVQGTEFGAFSDSRGSTSTSAPIAQLVATDVGSTAALLKCLDEDPDSPLELPNDTYVTVIKYNDHTNVVRVAAPEKSTLPAPWPEVLRNLEFLPTVWTKPGEPSDLILVPKDNGLELQRNTYSLEQPGPAHIHIKHSADPNQLFKILSAIIHFHFHLQRQNPEAPLLGQLEMGLWVLEKTGYKRWGLPEYGYEGEDLFRDSLVNGTIAGMRADTNKLFGLILTNNSDLGLFPYVFYYNLEDYSVSCLYGPPSRTMKAPLPAGGSLSDCFSIGLTNPASKREYGIFVLLAFTEWVDIAYMQQESPFGTSEGDLRRCLWTMPRPPKAQNAVRTPGGSWVRRLGRVFVWDKISVRVRISL